MSWATALAAARRHWPLAIATLSAVVFAGLLLVTQAERDAARQALATEQAGRRADHDRAERQRAEQERGFAEQLAGATATFADRLAARAPVILRSTNTVRDYAQTDAGRARCLGADRVRGLDDYLAALASEDPASAGRGADAVRADPDPAPAGR
ncbi:hypothetical protein GCM10022253_26860 [Sphingomonas endophytica]|uniref:Uncharacterized protein n=1 Tax=Sphingomonas endophytica TaxID=869719 RepID=A0ABR6NCS1_9SPHN|nr:hypothetical protein [Sphingomonas endophytica]MBB5727542.1 hypothetical protein [Sphingomonas endophytica]